MLVLINKTSWNVALDGKPHLWTSALFNRGCIHPRTTFLDSYNQSSPLHSLTRTLMTMFYPSLDYLMSSDWALDPIYTWIHTTRPITPTQLISIQSVESILELNEYWVFAKINRWDLAMQLGGIVESVKLVKTKFGEVRW